MLGALPGAVPCARLHARLVLAEWDLKALAETAELVVSELVTNAVRTSAGLPERPARPADRANVAQRRPRARPGGGLGRRSPVAGLQQPDPDAEHGRGLLLVESLSEDWGTYRPATPRQDRLGPLRSELQRHRAFLNIDEQI